MATRERPLSPFMIGHVYRPQLTSVMSIIHRATGVALAFGGFGLAAWLALIAGNGDAYQSFRPLLLAWYGQAALFAFSFCLMYHLFNGLRHLAWDIGWGFEIAQVYRSGYTVIALSLLSTVAIWLIALGGGA